MLELQLIARLLLSRLEGAARGRAMEEEPGVASVLLAFDRLADPAARQLSAFEARAGRWEELRWSLERIRHRFGEGRLWRATGHPDVAALYSHSQPGASAVDRLEDLADAEILERGHDLITLERVWRMVVRAEYKRRQAPPGVKLGGRNFGRDRRYPITNAFRTGE